MDAEVCTDGMGVELIDIQPLTRDGKGTSLVHYLLTND